MTLFLEGDNSWVRDGGLLTISRRKVVSDFAALLMLEGASVSGDSRERRFRVPVVVVAWAVGGGGRERELV